MSQRPITEDDLQAYVDHKLSPEREAEVADYLTKHEDVARRVASYARQREDLRAAFDPIAEEPLPPELNLARLIEAQRRFRPDWPQMAAAAVVLLFIGGLFGGFGGWMLHGALLPPQEGIGALAQEAADSYRVYAPDHARPVEITASDRGALIAWASKRLGRKIAVPNLALAGYRFMGGRLVTTPHGPAVLFMYDNGKGRRLAMVSRPMKVDKNVTTMAESGQGNVKAFTWSMDGIGYSLVGTLPADMLHPLADEVRAQVRS